MPATNKHTFKPPAATDSLLGNRTILTVDIQTTQIDHEETQRERSFPKHARQWHKQGNASVWRKVRQYIASLFFLLVVTYPAIWTVTRYM